MFSFCITCSLIFACQQDWNLESEGWMASTLPTKGSTVECILQIFFETQYPRKSEEKNPQKC